MSLNPRAMLEGALLAFRIRRVDRRIRDLNAQMANAQEPSTQEDILRRVDGYMRLRAYLADQRRQVREVAEG